MLTESPPCCLLAEDQTLIGMALEAILEDAGVAVAGPFTSCEQALAWIEGHTPEIAIIDYKLKDGPCTELVKALRGRGVPVIIYSCYPRGADLPDQLRDVTWIEKPVARATLLDVLAASIPLRPVAKAS
jgi:DNA-binding NtrC family response regulator